MKHNFEERKQNRIDYAKEQAQKNRISAVRLNQSANDLASVIPMGQPILVGHHSEKSDRRYREKISNTFDQSRQAESKADYYQDKVAAIESNNAISSDDPQALQKIENKIDQLERLQEFMKSANKCVKKKDKEGFLKLAFATEAIWNTLNTPDFLDRLGYPSYRLTNNNANIRRLKLRRDELKKMEHVDSETIAYDGVKLVKNVEANRVQLIFEDIPSKPIREKLAKVYRFRWAPSEGAWQRHLNNSGIFEAKRFLEWFAENKG